MAKRGSRPDTTLITMPDAVDLIRFEKNLLQIGFFGAHERRGASAKSSRRIEQWVNRDGKKIKVSAEFRSSDSLGLPSTSDRDKYMGFMKLAMETKLRTGTLTNPIRFSGYSLLTVLGHCDSGENYEALNDWGMRMADTTITSEQIIYSSARKRYMNKTVHVFRSFTRLGSSNLDNTNKTDLFEVELEDWLLENLNESFVVPEDFNMYRKLVRPTAKGIFVYLYVWFFASQGKEVEKDYAELCTLLNVRCYEHVSKIKETMGLSLTDLVNIGYLQSWDVKPMSSKNGYKLILNAGPAIKDVLLLTQRKQIGSEEVLRKTPLSEQREVAKQSLRKQGVSDRKSTELAEKHLPEYIADSIEYVMFQHSCDTLGKIKNVPGLLISFIEDRNQIPSTFVTSNQRSIAEEKAARELLRKGEETKRQWNEMRLRSDYENWCLREADDAIAMLSETELTVRLKQVSSQLRKIEQMDTLLSRLPADKKRAELLSHLRREMVKELALPSKDEWAQSNAQEKLF